MTKPRILLALVILLLSSLTFAQNSRSSWVAANTSWQRFYSAFRAAVNKRDRAAMLRMMPDDFFDGGGGVTKDNGYYFEFRKDKKWYFAGVVGD